MINAYIRNSYPIEVSDLFSNKISESEVLIRLKVQMNSCIYFATYLSLTSGILNHKPHSSYSLTRGLQGYK
jgi:hypothetical protein